MAAMRSLRELKGLARTHSIANLKKLAESDSDLANQLEFVMPSRSVIRAEDLKMLDEGRECKLWGRDPNGERVCLEWA